MQRLVEFLILLCLVAANLGDSELCSKCTCYKKAVIQALYNINCSHLELHDTFPEVEQWPEYAIQQQTRMAVNFDWNEIHHLEKFPALPGIVSLSLRHNKMVKIDPKAFLQLDNLKTLDLSHNMLTAEGLEADVFRGPYSPKDYDPLGIVVLNLGNNQITSLSSFTFEHLPNLKELRLNNNPLKELEPSTIEALRYPETLQVLDLAYTGLSDLPESFVHLSSLRHKLQLLYLNGNKFTQVPESIAALGDSLEKLNLNDNPILELDEDSFRGLLVLRELNISAMTHLKRIGPQTFAHLKSLEILYSSYNLKLTDLDEEAFGFENNSLTLKELHLRSNALHSLPQHLVQWTDLVVVDVQNNPWRCDCDIEWLVNDLVPIIQNNNPDLVLDLHCSEPLWLSGVNIQTFRNGANSPTLCAHTHKSHSAKVTHRSTGLYTAFQAASIVLVISTTVGFIVLFYLKRGTNVRITIQMLINPNVRYIKTRNEV
ncbi:leucine-rich repeat-containing protein 15-like [Periplaneta americana]|uniref:leucine-rich repeat-containing protein 15-like n=1 Tax=Periplaneta americana TaxID=6978 RepID=UPI0037E9A870